MNSKLMPPMECALSHVTLETSLATLRGTVRHPGMRNKPRTETTQGEATMEPPAASHLPHLLCRLGRSASLHVRSVYQQVDQRSTLRSHSQVCFWTIAKVNERDVDEGRAFHFRSDGKLIQFDIHENSLDENTRLKGKSRILLLPHVKETGNPGKHGPLGGELAVCTG